MQILKELYGILKSVKLAAILLAVIGVSAALSTLVPQREDTPYYTERYGPLLARTITYLHFDVFFRSPLFLLESGLFFINLAACTAGRIAKQRKAGTFKRFGPDLIHIGILVLMAGAMVSLFLKEEEYIWLSRGEAVYLPGGRELVLTSFTYTAYADGRPRDYISSVDIRAGGKTERSAAIRVNRPLKIGPTRVYQNSYREDAALILRDDGGKKYAIRLGEGFIFQDRTYILAGMEGDWSTGEAGEKMEENTDENPVKPAVLVVELTDGAPARTHRLTEGDTVSSFFVEAIDVTRSTGLRIVRDPGILPVFYAFGLIGIGLAYTLIHHTVKGGL